MMWNTSVLHFYWEYRINILRSISIAPYTFDEFTFHALWTISVFGAGWSCNHILQIYITGNVASICLVPVKQAWEIYLIKSLKSTDHYHTAKLKQSTTKFVLFHGISLQQNSHIKCWDFIYNIQSFPTLSRYGMGIAIHCSCHWHKHLQYLQSYNCHPMWHVKVNILNWFMSPSRDHSNLIYLIHHSVAKFENRCWLYHWYINSS